VPNVEKSRVRVLGKPRADILLGAMNLEVCTDKA